MGHIYDMAEGEYRAVPRPEARGVASHELIGRAAGGRTRLAITRIEPGGAFGPHVDDYAHVICVVAGRGELKVGGRRHAGEPGTVMVTEPGEPHGMFASADEPLVLLAANLYESEGASGTA